MYLTRGDTNDRVLAEQFATKTLDRARDHGYAELERRAVALLDALPAT